MATIPALAIVRVQTWVASIDPAERRTAAKAAKPGWNDLIEAAGPQLQTAAPLLSLRVASQQRASQEHDNSTTFPTTKDDRLEGRPLDGLN